MKEQVVEKRTCPKCGRTYTERPARSRSDNETLICPDCGTPYHRSCYEKEGKCIITFQSAVEHFHYKEKDGNVVWGEKERKQQTKYNIELMYIQDEKLAKLDNAVGTTCPNCGAPIISLGAMRCEYCGLAVTPVNLKVWTLHRYYEVDYHHV